MKRNRAKTLVRIALVLFLAVAVIAGWLFFHIKTMNARGLGKGFAPQVRSSQYIVSSYNKAETRMELRFVLENPWPLGITIDSMQYTGFISQEQIVYDTYSKKSTIKASDTSLLYFPLRLKNEKMLRVLESKEAEKVDSVFYRIDFKIFADLPFLRGKAIPYTWEEKLPLYRVPEMKIKNIDIKKLGIKNAELHVDVVFVNPNIFPYKFRNSDFELHLDDELVGRGTSKELVVVPAAGTGTMNCEIRLNTVKAVAKGAKALLNKRNTSYFYRFRCTVVGKTPEEDSKLDFVMKGEQLPEN